MASYRGPRVLGAVLVALLLASCSPPGDELFIGRFRSERATFVELADMFGRHPDTRVMTLEYAIVRLPSTRGPVPFQTVPGWSRAEQEEERRVSVFLGDPTMVVALENAPGWSPGEIARFKGLFARIEGLLYVETDKKGTVMLYLYNKKILNKHRSRRYIAYVVDESAATPLVGSVADADYWADYDKKTGKWIGFRRLESRWFLVGEESFF